MSLLAAKSEYTAIGVMSGSSLDGLDIVWCRLDTIGGYRILDATTQPYPTALLQALRHCDQCDGQTLTATNARYSHWLGQTLAEQLHTWGVRPDVIGVHGHTVFHAPGQVGYSLQLGLGQITVSYLNAPLVTDFRNQDIALGGQGAPLVPAGEHALFPDTSVFVNLGGIANIGLHTTDKAVGYDLCGCNQILNALARRYNARWHYDKDGALAASGRRHSGLLAQLASLAFYRQPPPRSLANQAVADLYWPLLDSCDATIPDQLHTFCVHIANVIADALPKGGGKVMATGGGAHNRFLKQSIADAIQPKGYGLADVSEVLIDYKEALIFAWMALQVAQGQASTLPAATGARQAVAGGAIHLPPPQHIVFEDERW